MIKVLKIRFDFFRIEKPIIIKSNDFDDQADNLKPKIKLFEYKTKLFAFSFIFGSNIEL